MIKYHLKYFDLRGRGEFIRYILHQAGEAFTDERITFEAWPTIKGNLPMGQLPLLEFTDGKWLCQSGAIARYLAKEFGLAGANHFESAQMDMLSDGLEDFFMQKLKPVVTAMFEKKPDEMKAAYDKIKLEDRKKFLAFYDKTLKANGGKWMVGNKVSWVDLQIAENLDRYETSIDPEFMNGFPDLKAYVKSVHELPNIAKYIKERPKTFY